MNMNGSSTSITLGVNYYPNPNVKLMLNYGIVDNDEYATGRRRLQGRLRLQLPEHAVPDRLLGKPDA